MTLEEMRQIKQERGYSLAQLSEYSGVPLGTLQKIFQERQSIPDMPLALRWNGYSLRNRYMIGASLRTDFLRW